MTTLDPKAVQIAQDFYSTRLNFALHVQDHLIALLNRNGLTVYASDALPEDVFAQLYTQEGQKRVVIQKGQPLIRKRFILAKALARELLGQSFETLSTVKRQDCSPIGEQMLENHLACALLVPQVQVRAAYLKCRTLEQFAAHFGISVPCAKICLATYESPKAVALMQMGGALDSHAGGGRFARVRPVKNKESSSDWTSELVSAGLGAALSAAAASLLGF